MFEKIQFLSIDDMKKVKPSLNIVVVSILDNSESAQRPRLGGFRSVISLEFEDTYEEARQLGEITYWPDEPTLEDHARLSIDRNERVPSLSDATKIVEFLTRFGTDSDKLTLVVHCHGGISRSAAVAAWASKRFFVPIDSKKTTDRANKRLLRLMDTAWKNIDACNDAIYRRHPSIR